MAYRIVVIEDDPKTARLINTLLSAEKFEVILAADGEEGLNAVSEHRPDLIITDILLPKKDGYIICEIIRKSPDLKHIPIILLSAIYVSEADKKRGLEIGADRFLVKPNAFISKPFRANELMDSVKELLGEKRREAKETDQDTVLIVDDDLKLLRLLEFRLNDDGYRTLLAEDGYSALDTAHLEQPDLVIMDYQMPGMNGIEVLERLKEEQPETAVVLMTAYGSEKLAVKAMRQGADDYLVKPLDYRELRFTIRDTIEKCRLRAAQEKLTEQLKKISVDLLDRISKLEKAYRELENTNKQLVETRELMAGSGAEIDAAGDYAKDAARNLTEMMSRIEIMSTSPGIENSARQILEMVRKSGLNLGENLKSLGRAINRDVNPFQGS